MAASYHLPNPWSTQPDQDVMLWAAPSNPYRSEQATELASMLHMRAIALSLPKKTQSWRSAPPATFAEQRMRPLACIQCLCQHRVLSVIFSSGAAHDRWFTICGSQLLESIPYVAIAEVWRQLLLLLGSVQCRLGTSAIHVRYEPCGSPPHVPCRK